MRLSTKSCAFTWFISWRLNLKGSMNFCSTWVEGGGPSVKRLALWFWFPRYQLQPTNPTLTVTQKNASWPTIKTAGSILISNPPSIGIWAIHWYVWFEMFWVCNIASCVSRGPSLTLDHGCCAQEVFIFPGMFMLIWSLALLQPRRWKIDKTWLQLDWHICIYIYTRLKPCLAIIFLVGELWKKTSKTLHQAPAHSPACRDCWLNTLHWSPALHWQRQTWTLA